MTDYDVIVIGSGIGGSVVGAILASNGLKTLILEKNKLIGGRCSTYEKEGFKVDVGVHSFGRSGRGPLGKALSLIGKEDAIDWVIAKSPGPRWYYKGEFLRFPLDFINLLPPSDSKTLMKILTDIMNKRDTTDLENIDLKTWLSQYTDNISIHSFFKALCWMYFVVPYYEASAGEFLKCLSSLSKDLLTGYPRGGCISIPLAYTGAIEQFGGVVETNSKVEKIIIEEGKVKGIELSSGKVISSNIIISNSGIKETVNNMVGRKHFNNDFLKVIDKLKYSMSAITLKIALKKPVTDLKVLMTISSEDPIEYFEKIKNGKVPDDLDFFIPVPSNYDSGLTPNGKQLITAGTIVDQENFEKNEDRWVKTSLENLDRIFPDLSDNMLWLDLTTPEDINSFGGKEAAVVGISQIVGQTGYNRLKSALPIEGLYIVGGDAGGWGIGTEMAANSAIDCSETILKEKFLW
ncbi:MAG: phytoene desaturase family protein [Promethearchaeota archaeon]